MSAERVAAVSAAVDALVGVDGHLLGPAQLVGAMDELHAASLKLAATFTRMMAAALEQEAIRQVAGRAPRSWLIEDQLLAPATASRQLRLVLELAWRPALRAAYDVAALSGEHALVVLDALKQVPAAVRDAVEEALILAAAERPPHALAELVDEILVRLGIEKSSDEAAAKRYARRGVTVDRTFGGTGSLSGTLSVELTEKLQRIFTDCAAPCGAEDHRSAAQRRHDRLDEMADAYLADPRADSGASGVAAGAADRSCADVPPTQAPRAQVVVTIGLEALLDELSTRWGTLDTGVPVSPAVARRLACDAEIIPTVLDSRGDVLDIGVASRSFSTACAVPRSSATAGAARSPAAGVASSTATTSSGGATGAGRPSTTPRGCAASTIGSPMRRLDARPQLQRQLHVDRGLRAGDHRRPAVAT